MRVDGNAVAGALAEVFGRDVSLSVASCAHCGFSGVLAECIAYVTPLGSVLRCAGCEGLLAVVTSAGGRMRVSMPGVRSLELPSAADDAAASAEHRLDLALRQLRDAERALDIEAERHEDF